MRSFESVVYKSTGQLTPLWNSEFLMVWVVNLYGRCAKIWNFGCVTLHLSFDASKVINCWAKRSCATLRQFACHIWWCAISWEPLHVIVTFPGMISLKMFSFVPRQALKSS